MDLSLWETMIKFDWRIFHSFLSVFKGKVVDHSELSALSSTPGAGFVIY